MSYTYTTPSHLNTGYTVNISPTSSSLYTIGAPGHSGIYITSGSNGAWSSVNQNAMSVDQSGKVELKGKNADITINGKSLKEFMEVMEQRLNWLRPNTALEKDWEELKALGDAYRELEKHINEKMETWDILKKE